MVMMMWLRLSRLFLVEHHGLEVVAIGDAVVRVQMSGCYYDVS